MSDQPASTPRKGSFIARFLTFVEWLGNLLPHPVTLFALFALGIIVISAITSALGVSVADPRPGNEGILITTNSLLAPEGIRWLFQNIVPNFSGFTPLGTVLVALLGVGVAERSGLLTAIIRGAILWAPPQFVTLVVVFAAVVSNTASEMGYVVIIPLAMAIFHALGRHPLAGMAAAFAGVSGGYSANILIGTVDPLLAGITEEAAQLIDPAYEVSPVANYYFMAGSTLLVTLVCWFITAKMIEPRLGKYDQSEADESLEPAKDMTPLTKQEKKGIVYALSTAAILLLAIAWIGGPEGKYFDFWLSWAHELPGWGIMQNPEMTVEDGPNLYRPLLRSVVTFIFIIFVIPGFVYGKVVGTMKNDRDIIHSMDLAMRSMGLYIVLVFFAAQFVAFFNYSNLGQILAVVGADALVAMNLDNPIVFIPFIFMCCFVNLMLGSASAQWAATAPIFVPMLMTIGYSPEVIQAAYRIGDSTTNTVTPMMSYFGLILAITARYKKDIGIGTMISTMLPYCIAMIVCWIAFFYLWVFLLGWPVGPGSPTTYTLPT